MSGRTNPIVRAVVLGIVGVLTAATATPLLGQQGTSPAASANRAVPPRNSSTDAPDRVLGGTLASRGAAGVAACSTCHGGAGEGNGPAGFPRIAGQPSAYLQKQLEDYAAGRRRNAVMQPIATAMNDAQRRAAASYYAGLPTPPAQGASAALTGTAPASAATAEARGRTLSNVGDNARRLQACANCHGPDGSGQEGAIPYLAGQHREYLLRVLGEWKDGSRDNDPAHQMPAIAKALSDQYIDAAATYFAAQPVPSRRDMDVAQKPAGSRAVVSGPTTSATPKQQGIGTEQGGPVVGGGVGPGGAATQRGKDQGGGGPAGPAASGSKR